MSKNKSMFLDKESITLGGFQVMPSFRLDKEPPTNGRKQHTSTSLVKKGRVYMMGWVFRSMSQVWMRHDHRTHEKELSESIANVKSKTTMNETFSETSGHVYMYMCRCRCMCACICTYLYVYMYLYVDVDVCICMCACICVWMQMYVYLYLYVFVCVHVSVCRCRYMYSKH